MKKKKFDEAVKLSDLINIQKLVFLLDENHYQKFLKYLENVQAKQCARLVETIKEKLPLFHHHQELCETVYGENTSSSRTRFNQLTVTCFKLSEYLAVNHPSYLIHNIQNIHSLICDGKRKEATFLAAVAFELSQKTEDYTTQILVLKFLIEEELKFNKADNAGKYYELLEEAIAREKLINQIIFEGKKMFSVFGGNYKRTDKEIDEGIKYYSSFNTHPSILVKMLAQYIAIYIPLYHRRNTIYTKEFKKSLIDFEKLLTQYSYIVHPFMMDMKSFMYSCRIIDYTFDPENKEEAKEIAKFEKHIRMVEYWKSFIHLPEVIFQEAKLQYYLNKYVNLTYRKDYHSLVPHKVLKEFKSLLEFCKNEVDRFADDEDYNARDKIKQRFWYATILLLQGDAESLNKSVTELETTFFSFQQVSKTGFIDIAFLILMIGYFSLQNYQKCKEVYRRFLKLIKNRRSHPHNVSYLITYFQVSAWFLDKDKSHLAELKVLYNKSNDVEIKSFIKELSKYYQLPVFTN